MSVNEAWQAALLGRSDLTRSAVLRMLWPDLKKIRNALQLLDEVTEQEINRRQPRVPNHDAKVQGEIQALREEREQLRREGY